MSTSINSPIGILKYITNENHDIFLQGEWNTNETIFSIEIDSILDLEKIDFSFVQLIMNNINSYINISEKYLETIFLKDKTLLGYQKEEEVKISKPVICEASVIFRKDRKWEILFASCVFPIGDPYGILINFQDQHLVDFENLSFAEEL